MNESQIKNKGYQKFNRANAIALFCRECFGYDGHYSKKAGTPFQKAGSEVRECPSTLCPLFCFRTGKDERPTKVIRKMTEEHKRKLLGTNKNNVKKG